MDFSLFWRLGCPRSGCQPIQWELSFWLVDGHLLLVSSHSRGERGRERGREWGGIRREREGEYLFIRPPILLHKGPTFKGLIYSLSLHQRPYLQIQSCWGLGLQHMNRRIGAPSCPSTWVRFIWPYVLSVLAADVNLLLCTFLFLSFARKPLCFLQNSIWVPARLYSLFLSFLSLCYCLGSKKVKMFSKFVFCDLKVLVQIANTEVYVYKQDSEIITDSLIQ